MPTPSNTLPGGKKVNRVEIYGLKGKVRRTEKTVVMEIDTGDTRLELHFGDPAQMMNFCLLMIEEMAQVFPDFEASKLWLDDNFK
jgi:hypothetical protein